jgi:hypothetical protein
MTLDDAIATLDVREINWDGGIRVWIGDRVNGHTVETIFSHHRTAPVLGHSPYDGLRGALISAQMRMSPLCQFGMTLPERSSGGVWGDISIRCVARHFYLG